MKKFTFEFLSHERESLHTIECETMNVSEDNQWFICVTKDEMVYMVARHMILSVTQEDQA